MSHWLQLTACLLAALAGAAIGAAVTRRFFKPAFVRYLKRHFGSWPLASLVVTERQFPARVRVDLQQALDKYLDEQAEVEEMFGMWVGDSHFFGMSLTSLLTAQESAGAVPLTYDEVDVGEDAPARCLGNTMWLLRSGKNKYAVLISKVMNFHDSPKIRIDVATPHNDAGTAFTQALFQVLEQAVKNAQSYRGKILSLEAGEGYTGQATGITVHKLPPVARADVVLPAQTLEMLERNVVQFVKQRPRLAALGQSVRKGLLFFGAPGNGKTHTLHYLINELAGHTTLLISAEQVGHLSEYMTLARLFQPSILILEDVDLIARDREHSGSPCQESLLNKLLNEMDGLKADAEILFLLTTNRPEALEEALSARPGRVDQAIEFPAPDDAGREKLLRLYARSVDLAPDVLEYAVSRTAGVSAAFIKELVRRSLQVHLAQSETAVLEQGDIAQALDELVSASGQLDRRLLGFADGHARTKELHTISASRPATP